jgi:nucleotide-binding universal stress UspA family protein
MARPTQIVLAVRVGEASAAPARTAVWLASRLEADVTVVYIATELKTVAQVAKGAGLLPEDVRARMIEEARERALSWGRNALEGRPFDVRIEEGDVAERIAAAAADLGAELVVVGTEARGAIQGLILGETTRQILRRTPCPVVVVPPLAERR